MRDIRKIGRPDEQPSTDRLRGDIDSGATGDKVGHPDPSAAPLGTDDEAAGLPPGGSRTGTARAAELRQGARAKAGGEAKAASDEGGDDRPGAPPHPAPRSPWPAIAVAALGLALAGYLLLGA